MSDIDVKIMRERYKDSIPMLGVFFVDEYGKLRQTILR